MRDKYDALFDETTDYRSLMGSEDVEPGLERADGFYIAHEVRATVPWAESLVRKGERPRVQNARTHRKCDHCGEAYVALRSTSLYCGPKCRVAANRAK